VSDLYRCSFDAVADVYESGRPPYADAAIAWIAERLPCGDVLDLAAGTGKLTRQLVPLARHVVAVEPGAEMRRVFATVLPDVELLAGRAEEIPLPDGSVDTVTVGQAFHWFRAREAFAEVHRVLRPGGGFAILGNVWKDEDPLLRALHDLTEPLRRNDGAVRGWRADIPDLFASVEERVFRQPLSLTVETLVAWVLSTSAVSTLPATEQQRLERDVRLLAGAEVVEVTLATGVTVADRV
jgi:ubiquinone/menaquinone biosynthesis C-methylase UbiE